MKPATARFVLRGNLLAPDLIAGFRSRRVILWQAGAIRTKVRDAPSNVGSLNYLMVQLPPLRRPQRFRREAGPRRPSSRSYYRGGKNKRLGVLASERVNRAAPPSAGARRPLRYHVASMCS